MYTEIVGTQQIVITVLFLAAMFSLLFFLRRKSGVIRASLTADKRIAVIEDRAVSPYERLRIVGIDDREFIMVSAKGQASYLLPLDNGNAANNNLANHNIPEIAPKTEALIETKPDTPSKITQPSAEHAAFLEKFQSWRSNNVVR